VRVGAGAKAIVIPEPSEVPPFDVTLTAMLPLVAASRIDNKHDAATSLDTEMGLAQIAEERSGESRNPAPCIVITMELLTMQYINELSDCTQPDDVDTAETTGRDAYETISC